MTLDAFWVKKKKIEAEFGPWTAHNIMLDENNYTLDKRIVGDEVKLKRIIQITSDLTGVPFEKLRILDLACLEGLYGIEAARQGASVVALDVRKGNIEKTKLVCDYLNLNNIEMALDDVRNISKEKYGEFDVVYCFGILYHLDAPDVFEFVKKLCEVTKKVLILDTQICLNSGKKYNFEGNDYYGRHHTEHRKKASKEEKERDVWLSIDNIKSFWLTRPSLLNLLKHAGFSSAYECYMPFESHKPINRVTLAVFKGDKKEIISAPLVNNITEEKLSQRGLMFFVGFYFMIFKNSLRYHIGKYTPLAIKNIIRKRRS